MAHFLVLHGPNLNLLGSREPEVYGYATLDDINRELTATAQANGHTLTALQSNAEHVLIDSIQQARGKVDMIIFNPAGYTHTSVALRDALLAVQIPFIEVHLSDPKKREPFRHHSYFSDIATQVVSGHGAKSYPLALQAAIDYTQRKLIAKL